MLAAVQGVFGECPDVVITGPNPGLNLGPLVLHSGTVGAAVTAASNSLPGIALSTEKRARFGFTTAAEFCARNLGAMLNSMGEDSALNINVPDLPLDQIGGIRLTRFAPMSLTTIVIRTTGFIPKLQASVRCVSHPNTTLMARCIANGGSKAAAGMNRMPARLSMDLFR